MSLDQRRLIAAVYLAVATLALAASVAALLATGPCPRYTLPDLFRCGVWGYAAAFAEALAAASLGVFVLSFPSRSWPSPTPVSSRIGLAACSVAALSSLLLPFGPTETLFQAAAVGWMAFGTWLVDVSRHGPDQLRSTTGTIVGVTLAAWAFFAIFNEDRPVATGGAYFLLLFGFWALRTGWRLVRGYRLQPSPVKNTGLIGDLVYSTVAAVGIVFIALPLWMVSTLGVPLGDPVDGILVRNETTTEITFYVHADDVGRFPGTHIGPGQEAETGSMVSSTYRVVAIDRSDVRLYCHTFSRHDLRVSHFIIVVRDDPGSCR